MPHSLLIARFPFGNSEAPSVSDWLAETYHKAKLDPRISAVHRVCVDDTPITMSRNRVLKAALEKDIDLVLMVDSDMKPDADLGLPGVRPFWDSSLEFVLSHEGPCAIAAPYCGPPPHENVYVFQWGSLQSDNPNADMQLLQYSREHAMLMGGIQEAAALPTGVFLLDVRAIKAPGVKPPWFEYEWADPPFNTKKASTEDVFFTRNLSLAGVPVYCNWDAWAGHHKRKCVGKPQKLTVDSVREQFRDAVVSGVGERDRLIDVKPGGVKP